MKSTGRSLLEAQHMRWKLFLIDVITLKLWPLYRRRCDMVFLSFIIEELDFLKEFPWVEWRLIWC